ncbi:MAG: hypothetical protein WDN06_19555 [Asticcacaulis sp.]
MRCSTAVSIARMWCWRWVAAVVGDLTGFACAVYMRGIDFIQIPTTVLAQVDSSVGGKTAIDHEKGKNLIGAFHQPRLVLCDLDVLKTLPEREIRCGYAEIIKYGPARRQGVFRMAGSERQPRSGAEPEAIQHAVARSVEMKAEIVASDEREGGVRALLNLGHTFGHALEAEVGFGGHAFARRGRRHRHGPRPSAIAPSMANAARTTPTAPSPPLPHAGLPTRMSDIRNTPLRRRPPSHPYGPRQEGRRRRPDLRAGGRYRPRLRPPKR